MPVHLGVVCECCRSKSFEGIRYKCYTCPNYNVCGACIDEVESSQLHDPQHQFLRLKDPPPSPVLPPAQGVGEGVSAVTGGVHSDLSQWLHREPCHSCRGQIVGYRYFCAPCGVSLCAQCEFMGGQCGEERHDPSHPLLKLAPPSASATTSTTAAAATEPGVAAASADFPPAPPVPLVTVAPTLADYGVTVEQLKVLTI